MKKTNLNARKLSLTTETLMPLQDQFLTRVHGGADTNGGEVPGGGNEAASKDWQSVIPTSCLTKTDGPGKCQFTSFVKC